VTRTPPSFFARCAALVVSCVLVGLVVAACGRSNLDDYLPPDGGVAGDGGAPPDAHSPDASVCNASTCPSGCCEGAVCVAGSSLTACGSLGETCQNCSAEGFQICDATRHACGNPVAACGPSTCKGCCEGNVCFAGVDPNECGAVGGACQHCATEGLACSGQRCVKPACGQGTCGGCCFGDQCLGGTDQTACGEGGQVCGNCAGSGGKCVAGGTGGVCVGLPACNPTNCTGCCQGSGCFPGTAQTQCGFSGQACTNCAALGESCMAAGPEGGTCTPQPLCNGSNCAGCCQGDLCLPGNSPNQCGSGGAQCTDCSTFGESCQPAGAFGGFCSGSTGCSSATCKGCCDGAGNCAAGSSSTACGLGGQICIDCSAASGTCSGGVCLTPPPTCDAKSCPKGCCSGTACLPGTLDSFCGTGGVACANCPAQGASCHAQKCVGSPPKCNGTNCTGCCDATAGCQPGFIDAQCGQSGASCVDCTTLNPASTCDVSVTPRVCVSQQATCPGPYPSCPASLETPSPAQQKVCSPSDLQNAQSACTAGAHTAACDSFFQFEAAQNPACAKCLSAFDYDFSELTGLTTCAAPFVDAACNHVTACIVDCTDTACAKCGDPGALQQCQATVPNGVCSPYYQGAQCIQQAFFGPGAFCDPNQGTGLFGDWLQTVGANYCGL